MQESSTSRKPILLWFRQDLRLEDNPALQAAMETGRPIVPVYVLDDEGEREWAPGGASRWWLHHALIDLDKLLKELGSSLLLRQGNSLEQLRAVIRETGATAVNWNRRYEPYAIARDKLIKQTLLAERVEVQSFNAALLHEPHTVSKKDGTPYKVFTPYWKYCLGLKKPTPLKFLPGGATFWKKKIVGEKLEAWKLLPSISWDRQFYDAWDPTIDGAKRLLKSCVGHKVNRYERGRDMLAEEGTSKLSPYLHFGQISPRQIWHAVSGGSGVGQGVQRYLAELGWREFSYYLLYHFPHTPDQSMRVEFEDFPWSRDERLLEAWTQGKTGFPVVDAGMRQLWKTGWMHNRARMITASFLVKHLLQPWQDGARWFWDTLVDADLASNTQGWQWTAGCGADASPYFRVFNPILQGEKFDPEGAYVRKWVPELKKLPNRLIHKPWEADAIEQADAGVSLGKDYPHPVIDHAAGRARALKAYELFKASN